MLLQPKAPRVVQKINLSLGGHAIPVGRGAISSVLTAM